MSRCRSKDRPPHRSKEGPLQKAAATKSKLVALSVVDFRIAKEGGLVFDLRTVADDHDLHIRGVEIFSRSGHQLGRSDLADVVPISFQIIRGKLVQLDG